MLTSSLFLTVPLVLSSFALDPNPAVIKKSAKFSPMTKDITIVGWVSRDAVPPPSTENVSLALQLKLNNDPASCLLLLDSWASGLREDITNDNERRYANAFLLRESKDSAPPRPTIDPGAVASGGEYRIFNRAKVEFSVKDGKVFGAPRFVHVDHPIVGRTPEPCTALHVRVDGQTHPENGARDKTPSETVVYQLNEGRIGIDGQKVDRTLNACEQFDCQQVPIGPTTPWIWSVIRFDVAGNPIFPPDKQMFPTYTIYVNGQFVQETIQSDAEAFISLDESSQRRKSEIQ